MHEFPYTAAAPQGYRKGKAVLAPIAEILRILAALALGLFAGSMLTEALVLVPFWRALAPEAFLAWYAQNDARLLDYFGPITSVAGVTAVASAMMTALARHPSRGITAVAAVLMVAVVSTFYLYFRDVNLRFAAGSIAPEAVAGELARWAAWHWARTVVSVLAFTLALLGAARNSMLIPPR